MLLDNNKKSKPNSFKHVVLLCNRNVFANQLFNLLQPSCRKRLKRALLLLEFVNAAIEGKIQDANRVLEELVEAQSILSRFDYKKFTDKI